jgi:hypothetical protein
VNNNNQDGKEIRSSSAGEIRAHYYYQQIQANQIRSSSPVIFTVGRLLPKKGVRLEVAVCPETERTTTTSRFFNFTGQEFQTRCSCNPALRHNYFYAPATENS